MKILQSKDVLTFTKAKPILEEKQPRFEKIKYLDMAKVHFIDSSDVAELLSIVRNGLNEGIEIRFINITQNVKEYIKKRGLEQILYIE